MANPRYTDVLSSAGISATGGQRLLHPTLSNDPRSDAEGVGHGGVQRYHGEPAYRIGENVTSVPVLYASRTSALRLLSCGARLLPCGLLHGHCSAAVKSHGCLGRSYPLRAVQVSAHVWLPAPTENSPLAGLSLGLRASLGRWSGEDQVSEDHSNDLFDDVRAHFLDF